MTTPEIKVLADPKTQSDAAAAAIFEAIQTALKGKPTCGVCLAGGTTPRAAYEGLRHRDAKTARRPLASVEFWFGDERCVPPDDAESNYKMARDALGGDRRFHRIEAERDPDAAARDYERVLPREIDVLILGIGDDGHTASLFPGSPAAGEFQRRVVPVTGAPKPPPTRITITPPVIESARRIFMLVVGEAKSDAVKRALEGAWNPKETPSQHARRGTWILDAAAASKLKR